uniref:Uncharacterized protein n=1 Tax=Romanomermis culicivorax TaxID=13658 RepID=A0A915K580_ROMCU
MTKKTSAPYFVRDNLEKKLKWHLEENQDVILKKARCHLEENQNERPIKRWNFLELANQRRCFASYVYIPEPLKEDFSGHELFVEGFFWFLRWWQRLENNPEYFQLEKTWSNISDELLPLILLGTAFTDGKIVLEGLKTGKNVDLGGVVVFKFRLQNRKNFLGVIAVTLGVLVVCDSLNGPNVVELKFLESSPPIKTFTVWESKPSLAFFEAIPFLAVESTTVVGLAKVLRDPV